MIFNFVAVLTALAMLGVSRVVSLAGSEAFAWLIAALLGIAVDLYLRIKKRERRELWHAVLGSEAGGHVMFLPVWLISLGLLVAVVLLWGSLG